MVYFFDTRRWPMVVDSVSDFNICEKVENKGESGERKHVFDLNISTCMWTFLWVNVCKLYLDLLYVWFYVDHKIQDITFKLKLKIPIISKLLKSWILLNILFLINSWKLLVMKIIHKYDNWNIELFILL